MRYAMRRARARASRRSRGQTLVIVALLLPILVLILAVVMDVVNLSIQRQRIEGKAQLAADAGATIAAGDVSAILIVRHWCQKSISFAAWDTPACASFDRNTTDSNLITLNQDCPWTLQSRDFVGVSVSDSNILADCISRSPFGNTGWEQAITNNLAANGTPSDVASPRLSCAGLSNCNTSGSYGCANPQAVCIEVSVTAHVTALVVGLLTAASPSTQVRVVADASFSLPGTCSQLKGLILGAPGNCPVR